MKKRDIEKEYTRKQYIAKIRRLADALESGKPFRIHVGKEKLYIPANAVINIEYEREKDSEELEFQLKWKNK